MSDSKKHKDESNQQVKGTIFMGPNSDQEATVDNFSIIQSQNPWDRRTESDYMERVREKAALRVQAMLSQARSNAEAMRKTARQWIEKIKEENHAIHEQAKSTLQEAEQIKAEAQQIQAIAHEEGLRKGVEQAMQELEEHRNLLNATLASVLKTIEGQCSIIFENWRLELADLLKTSVEVAIGWLLSKEYTSILESLLSLSIQKLEEHQQITIRINKNDQEIIGDIITSAKNTFPELKSWEIKIDPSLNAGDLIVESTSGMVDSRLNTRQEEVKKILQHLTIPESTIEHVAHKNISSTLDSTGITATADEKILKESLGEKSHEVIHTDNKNTLTKSDENTSELEISQEPEEFSFPELEGIELPPDEPILSTSQQATIPEDLKKTDESLLNEITLQDDIHSYPTPHEESPNIPNIHESSPETTDIVEDQSPIQQNEFEKIDAPHKKTNN